MSDSSKTVLCKDCNIAMISGTLAGEGAYWRPLDAVPMQSLLRPKSLMGSHAVTAFKCPNCGKLELFIES